MNFTDKDVKKPIGCLYEITLFVNTGSYPVELVSERQERQLERINQVRCGSMVLLVQNVEGK